MFIIKAVFQKKNLVVIMEGLALLAMIIAIVLFTSVSKKPPVQDVNYTGKIEAFIPAADRGISDAPDWWFVCFADGGEFYVRGITGNPPNIAFNTDLTVTFKSVGDNQWVIGKVKAGAD